MSRSSPSVTCRNRPRSGSSRALALLAGLTACGLAGAAHAGEVELHGFVQGNYSCRSTGLRSPGGSDFVLGEERLQLALSGVSPGGRSGFLAKTDLIHDGIVHESDVEVREGYVDLGAGPLDLRAGRQIVTWGTGDLLFINDVFPKDWFALFTGRPLEYLKVGLDALKVDWYAADVGFEVIASPFFEPDRLPSPDHFFVPDPFPGTVERVTNEPSVNLDDAEVAIRASRSLIGWDCALYADRGFYRVPSAAPDTAAAQVVMSYPRRNVYGASLQRAALGGVVSLEGGYYDSRDDPDGTDPLLPNSQALYLAGYRRQLGRSLTMGLQYYGESMSEYSSYQAALPEGAPQRDRQRSLVTGRVTWLSNYQTWKASFFGYWSPTDEDFYLIPEVWHSFADGVWAAVGGNIFGGSSETTFFGALDRNDNVYAAVRYEF